MKQADIENTAYEIVDHFTEKEVLKVIQAVEEAPQAFARALRKELGE